MLDQLGVPQDQRGFDQIGGAARIPNGHSIGKPEPVFPRNTDGETAE